MSSDNIRSMVALRVVSVDDPIAAPALVPLALRLVWRGQVMGFLPEGVSGDAELDRSLLEQIGAELAARGIAQEAALSLAATADASRLEAALRSVLAAVDDSPQPDGEWESARELLGDELLARLVGISPASLRRYASGARSTPDDTAWRLHAVARILAALLGSYNPYGIRRWFERPRAALGGETPAAAIAEAASEEDERLLSAVALAESLVGAADAA